MVCRIGYGSWLKQQKSVELGDISLYSTSISLAGSGRMGEAFNCENISGGIVGSVEWSDPS